MVSTARRELYGLKMDRQIVSSVDIACYACRLQRLEIGFDVFANTIRAILEQIRKFHSPNCYGVRLQTYLLLIRASTVRRLW